MRKVRLLLAVGTIAVVPAPALARTERGPSLPPELTSIVLRVAGDGRPGCRSYHPDGSEGPCLPRLTLKSGGSINAHHQAGTITFTRAAAVRLSPDEFALLAGHELAHWYLGHRGQSAEAELAADRLGAQLACQAGYDMQAAAALFRYVRSDRHYPPPTERRAAVLAEDCAKKD